MSSFSLVSADLISASICLRDRFQSSVSGRPCRYFPGDSFSMSTWPTHNRAACQIIETIAGISAVFLSVGLQFTTTKISCLLCYVQLVEGNRRLF
jgi:hypothetical protein